MLEQIFIPGSCWIYLKIYTGEKTADNLLTHLILPFTQYLYNEGLISKFFFVRYADPDFHIRIRFLLNDNNCFNQFYNRLYKIFNPYMRFFQIWRIEISTYERENERYGKDNIEDIESLFSIDSIYALYALRRIKREQTKNSRWKYALLFIQQTLKAFNLSVEKSCTIFEEMQHNYRLEFGFLDHSIVGQLDNQYRIFRKQFEYAIISKDGEFSKRYEEICPICNRIISRDNNVIIYKDIIHMINNRLFIHSQRQNEMVLYYYLYKSYRSIISRLSAK